MTISRSELPTVQPRLLFLGTPDDEQYKPRLKQLVAGCSTYVLLTPISTLAEIEIYCRKREITGVISTNSTLLEKLVGKLANGRSPSLSNYAGSLISRGGIDYVFIEPLEQFITVNYYHHVTRRYISKVATPHLWRRATPFSWEILDATNADEIFAEFSQAIAIACDIETFKTPLSIRCIGYTAILTDSSGNLRTRTCVLPIDSSYNLSLMRKFNWELQPPKIFQNGKYDVAYLSMYDAVPYNWLWDTINLFHCWYSELPKDLASINAYCVRESMYWKDLANTSDLYEYYKYNGLDSWATANSWITQMLEIPQYARENYLIEFPLVFPCHLSEMTGIARDMHKLRDANKEYSDAIKSKNASLSRMLGVENFNTNSPKQMKALLAILGCSDLPSTDEKNLAKAQYRHPLNNRILELVLEIRGDRKLVSTYLPVDNSSEPGVLAKDIREGKEHHGRILYALNPHGTDTGRLASREHHFWCGLQIQNISRGKAVKQTLQADPGFLFGECDLEQAESRDTAFIAGDESLIAAVTGTQDFHSLNASKFFGIPYVELYDDGLKKSLNKAIRDLSKRVNHGANYNMRAAVLVETMGLSKIYSAAHMLGLPRMWTAIQIGEYLLGCFHKTYPALTKVYYPWVIKCVLTSQMLVGATGWTRFCFGHPEKSKRDLNAYVAHPPQSLNAKVLNKAYMRVYYEIAISPKHKNNFKLNAQIHDSILFQFREGHHYLADMVKERMEIPVRVKGADDKWREFTVPAAIKAGKEGLGVKYWSEIE